MQSLRDALLQAGVSVSARPRRKQGRAVEIQGRVMHVARKAKVVKVGKDDDRPWESPLDGREPWQRVKVPVLDPAIVRLSKRGNGKKVKF